VAQKSTRTTFPLNSAAENAAPSWSLPSKIIGALGAGWACSRASLDRAGFVASVAWSVASMRRVSSAGATAPSFVRHSSTPGQVQHAVV
jgi:hypothetical protein